jgi:hypothetical protein
MATRPWSTDEKILARLVFSYNLPFDKIWIADDLGAGSAPWTDPLGGRFTIHLGKGGYADATSSNPVDPHYDRPADEIFIHELTHVWQSSHSRGLRAEYMVDSGISQAMLGRVRAYEYLPDKPWDYYKAEQQAQIVQDWYAGNPVKNVNRTYPPMSPYSPLFKFIVNPIRSNPMPKPDDFDATR